MKQGNSGHRDQQERNNKDILLDKSRVGWVRTDLPRHLAACAYDNDRQANLRLTVDAKVSAITSYSLQVEQAFSGIRRLSKPLKRGIR